MTNLRLFNTSTKQGSTIALELTSSTPETYDFNIQSYLSLKAVGENLERICFIVHYYALLILHIKVLKVHHVENVEQQIVMLLQDN